MSAKRLGFEAPERPDLAAMVKAASERYAALPPVDRAIHDVAQKMSFGRGNIAIDGEWTAAHEAALDADPAVVLMREVLRLRGEPVERVRHRKRGSTYAVVGTAGLQSSSGAIGEGEHLVVYRGEDGDLWARPEREFRDGRFETIAAGATGGRIA